MEERAKLSSDFEEFIAQAKAKEEDLVRDSLYGLNAIWDRGSSSLLLKKNWKF